MKKTKLLKKFMPLVLAAIMATGMSMNAMAANVNADGTEVTAPHDGEQQAGESYGAAIFTAEPDTDGTVTFAVTDDDDAVAAPADTDADINVWAKVTEHGDIVYKIDIEWGSMKFEFDNQTKTWDPDAHQYVDVTDDDGAKEWVVDGYIDGTNNKITVTNHSNAVVNAGFAYAHVLSNTSSLFNSNASGADAVRGHFFTDNANAVTASEVLTGSAAVCTGELTDTIVLNHRDDSNMTGYGGNDGSYTDDVFFTFNGTADDGLATSLADFKKVGVITVTITPEEAP